MNPFRHLVGLLGRGIGPSQGPYLHRTAQHRKTPCIERDSNPDPIALDRDVTVNGTSIYYTD